MNKNRHELPIYKSQAQRSNPVQISARLYGSGATVTSPIKNTSKLLETEPTFTRRDFQTERAIDNLSPHSRQSPTYCRDTFLARSKSGENLKWQSPTKQTISRQNFRSIIEQINQQNDRTFSQLDQDLKKIKSNLNRIQKESVQAKQSSHCQALTEQIDLLQQENERLREKNTVLTNDKRKMAAQIQQYQALIQREKSKQATLITSRHPTNDTKIQDLINNNKKLKQQLEYKDAQCQKLKSQNNQLSNVKTVAQKRQAMMSEQKNKLLSRLSEIQREKDSLKLKLQQQLRNQLEKKDAYYARVLKNQQLKYEQTILKLKASIMKSAQINQQELNSEKNAEIQRLIAQIAKLKNSETQLKNVQEESFKQFEQCNKRIDALRNQIEILNFSYKQSMQQLNQKDEIINQLNRKYQNSSKQSKKQSEQLLGMKQRLDQQNKKSHFLQQLCNKLERQIEQMQYEYQMKETSLNQAISDNEKQLNRLRMINQTLKQQNKDTENEIYELSRQNQKMSIELKRKAQEYITIKKQNLMLLSDRNNLRLRNAYSPQKNEGESEIEMAQQRLHRLHSARESRQQNELNTLRQKQLAKMKKIEKQLNELVVQFKAQNERTKTYYKQKEIKIQQALNQQKQKKQQLKSKIQKLENQIQLKKLEASQRQENNRQIIRKKQAQILIFERKQAQNKLKMSMIQTQNMELKKKLQKLESNKCQDKILSLQKKLQTFRSDYSKLLDTILKEISSIVENNISDSTNIKPQDYQVGSTEIKSYEQLHKIAQINYSIHSLKQTVRSLNKKIKQSSQDTRISENNQNSYIIDKSSSMLQQMQKQSTMAMKKNEKASKYFEQQYQKLQLKYSDLQKKHQRLMVDEKRKSKQLQELNEQLRVNKKELNRLKSQNQIIQDQKQDLRIKFKYCQDRLSKRQAQNLEQVSNKISYITPSKGITFYRSIQSQRQDQQSKLRSRIRSFKSSDKRQDLSQMRDYEKKISQYELTIGKLNRMLESKTQQIEWIQKQTAEIKQKQKKFQDKYQAKCLDYEKLQEKYEQQRKHKSKLQSRINHLENEQKVLINDLENIQTQYQQSIDIFQQQKQLIQKQNKQLLIQKELLQKKIRRDFCEKEEKYNSLIQQYQLRIIDLTSQSNKLKQTINNLTAKNESFSQKCDHLHQELNRKQEKIFENDIKTAQLRQRLQKQSKQKESMLNVFSNNTTRLTKLLQEKQIQIQQLRFIQESTIINLQYARNQQNKKKVNDSTYSFKNQF